MSDPDLLVLWERCAHRSAPERALAILALAAPTTEWDELLALPASERDRRLLDLRADLFGDRLEARAACAACAQDIELATRVSAMLASASATAEERVDAGGLTLVVRCPSAHELVRAARCVDAASARALLFDCCVTRAAGEPAVAATDLPAAARAAVFDALDRVAGAAALQLHVTCDRCGAETAIEFDIVMFLWHEIAARARRLAEEVVELARDLGWSEQDILTLAPMRRRLYLDVVRS